MRILATVLLCLFFIASNSQKETPFAKFGKITASDLQKKVYDIDSQAKAVVLKDYGTATIEGNFKGWFSFITTRHKIVHILNKNGYDKANIEIPLFRVDGSDERIINFKATTYNLENGKVVETKFSKDNMFTENVDKSRMVKKFTMPNVKEGCIIEYEYKVQSDFLRDMDPWIFQSDVPVLWSEFNFSVPGFFTYAPTMRGYLPLSFSERKDRVGSFTVVFTEVATQSERFNFTAGIVDHRWVMHNVPALEEESFTTSIKNHLSRMEFNMIAQSEPLKPTSFIRNWMEINTSLMESEYFGKYLSTNNWISEDIKPMFASSTNELERAKKIFSYVRDNFSCDGDKGIYLSESFKDIVKTKKGNVADINLLLTGLLKNNGLNANPVILSTRANGYIFDTYPTTKSFNYVIVQLKVNGNTYYLDASDPNIGFNYILPFCYNGSARIIGNEPEELSFPSRNLKENSTTNIFISNDDKGNWVGRVNSIPGMYKSFEIRNTIKEKGTESFIKDMATAYGTDVKVHNATVDSLKKCEVPVHINYEIDINKGDEDILYISPLFGDAWKKNPFNSLKRSYPVEMPYSFDEVVNLTMEIPKGYVVDELPKQVLVKFDESGASIFEFRITTSGNIISMRSRVKMSKAYFLPEEYEILRDFFGLVVKKHSEQIVLKKAK